MNPTTFIPGEEGRIDRRDGGKRRKCGRRGRHNTDGPDWAFSFQLNSLKERKNKRRKNGGREGLTACLTHSLTDELTPIHPLKVGVGTRSVNADRHAELPFRAITDARPPGLPYCDTVNGFFLATE